MPDFNNFRMNEKLLGESYALRKLNPCLDNINVNNPLFNSNIKVISFIPETEIEYSEWVLYIRNCSKRL